MTDALTNHSGSNYLLDANTLLVEQVLVAGEAEGSLMRLDRPISFWGGVDPRNGNIIDARHPQHGQNITGKILAMERTIGSSSGSSVMLELLAQEKGPAGLILVEADAILTLGAIVAREMGYCSLPVFLVDSATLDRLPVRLRMSQDGHLEAVEPC